MTTQRVPAFPFITRIRAERLFGQFDHDLHFADPPPENPNLLILYGENGTGKTTLLWLLFHLLNKEDRRGHRTFLAKHRFKSLCVTFSDGLELSADRTDSTIGKFTMRVRRGTRTVAGFDYKVEEDGSVKAIGDDKSHSEFAGKLPQFNFGFLPHDRLSKPETDVGGFRPGTVLREGEIVGAEEMSPTQHSISKAVGRARQQGIQASNKGQLTVNSIYAEVVQGIARLSFMDSREEAAGERKGLLHRLEEQAKLTREFSKFGLISELPVAELLQTLQTISSDRFRIAAHVLEPFLRGNEARLEALKPLHIALTTTVDTVNSLYLNKKIALDLERGMRILTKTGEALLPDQLSSGEQELIILFCEVISALRPNTILFIDEPELSLNVSWQKELLEALLRCASGSSVQFVIATHSIELLARYRPNVTRLSNKEAGPPQPISEGQKVEE